MCSPCTPMAVPCCSAPIWALPAFHAVFAMTVRPIQRFASSRVNCSIGILPLSWSITFLAVSTRPDVLIMLRSASLTLPLMGGPRQRGVLSLGTQAPWQVNRQHPHQGGGADRGGGTIRGRRGAGAQYGRGPLGQSRAALETCCE